MRAAAICFALGSVIVTPAVSQSTDRLSLSNASIISGVPIEDVRFLRSKGRGMLDGAVRISARIDRALAWRSTRDDRVFFDRIGKIYFTSPKRSLLSVMKEVRGKHRVKIRFLLLTHADEQISNGKATKDTAGHLYVGVRPIL